MFLIAVCALDTASSSQQRAGNSKFKAGLQRVEPCAIAVVAMGTGRCLVDARYTSGKLAHARKAWHRAARHYTV